jgi:hypothetical protein
MEERYGVAKDEAERQIGEWERDARSDWFAPDASGADMDVSRAAENEKVRRFDEARVGFGAITSVVMTFSRLWIRA